MTSRPSRHVRIGLVQHACGRDLAANVDAAERLIRDAAAQGAQLICTQELFRSIYFCYEENFDYFDLAEPIPGDTTHRFARLAAELNVEIIASLFERRAPGLYHNTTVLLGPGNSNASPADQTTSPAGEMFGLYRKMHIPDDPGFYEKFYFTPGDAAPSAGDTSGTDTAVAWQAHDTKHTRAGVLICWDQWYPEAARLTALRGAEVLFYPTAIGWVPDDPQPVRDAQRDAWRTMQRAHAIANGVYVCAVNRIGREGDLLFYGSSFIADPAGVVIAEAPVDEEAVLVVDCDLSKIETQRQQWPFLRDRRVDAYGQLTRRYVD